MTVINTWLTLLALLLALGCSKGDKSELSCPAVADKVVEILKSEMSNLDEAQRTALGAQLATVRSELIDDCNADPDFFDSKSPCIMKASSKSDLEACEKAGENKPEATTK